MSVELDVKSFKYVLELFQKFDSHLKCYVTPQQLSFIHMRQYDLIEYSIRFNFEQIQEHTKTFAINICDWLNALKALKNGERANINVIDFILTAHCHWGKIKVFNQEIDESFETVINSGKDKFVLPFDSFSTIVTQFAKSKMLYLQSVNNLLIFTDDDQKNIISVTNLHSDVNRNIPETAFDCSLVSNSLLEGILVPSVFLSFERDSPLHVEYDFFFQNKLRFVIAPILEDPL